MKKQILAYLLSVTCIASAFGADADERNFNTLAKRYSDMTGISKDDARKEIENNMSVSVKQGRNRGDAIRDLFVTFGGRLAELEAPAPVVAIPVGATAPVDDDDYYPNFNALVKRYSAVNVMPEDEARKDVEALVTQAVTGGMSEKDAIDMFLQDYVAAIPVAPAAPVADAEYNRLVNVYKTTWGMTEGEARAQADQEIANLVGSRMSRTDAIASILTQH